MGENGNKIGKRQGKQWGQSRKGLNERWKSSGMTKLGLRGKSFYLSIKSFVTVHNTPLFLTTQDRAFTQLHSAQYVVHSCPAHGVVVHFCPLRPRCVQDCPMPFGTENCACDRRKEHI